MSTEEIKGIFAKLLPRKSFWEPLPVSWDGGMGLFKSSEQAEDGGRQGDQSFPQILPPPLPMTPLTPQEGWK